MEKITLKDFYKNLNIFLSSNEEIKTVYAIYEQTEINYGSEDDCNIEYCIEHNIPFYNIGRSAGCCVNAKGNINIADIRSSKYGFIETKFTNDLCSYFKKRGLNVETNNNDILIDGYKVASCGGKCLSPDYKKVYTCFQISINQDMEVIKNVCKKEMKKVPKGLSDYGITTEEMEQFILNWFK